MLLRTSRHYRTRHLGSLRRHAPAEMMLPSVLSAATHHESVLKAWEDHKWYDSMADKGNAGCLLVVLPLHISMETLGVVTMAAMSD